MPWSDWQPSLLWRHTVSNDASINGGRYGGNQMAGGVQTGSATVAGSDVAADTEAARADAAASLAAENASFDIGFRVDLVKKSDGSGQSTVELYQAWASYDGTPYLTSDFFDTFPDPLIDLVEDVDYAAIPGRDGVYVDYESDTSTFYGWAGSLTDEVAHTFDPNWGVVLKQGLSFDEYTRSPAGETQPAQTPPTSMHVRFASVDYLSPTEVSPTDFSTLPVHAYTDGATLSVVTWTRAPGAVTYSVPLSAVTSPKWTLLAVSGFAASDSLGLQDITTPVTPASEWDYLTEEQVSAPDATGANPVVLFLTPRWRYWIPGPTDAASTPADSFSTTSAGTGLWSEDDGPADLSASADGLLLRWHTPGPTATDDGGLHVQFPPVALKGDLVSAKLVTVNYGYLPTTAPVTVRAADGSTIFSLAETGGTPTGSWELPADQRLLGGCSADISTSGLGTETWIDSVFLYLTSAAGAARVPPLRLRQRSDGVA